MNRHVSLCLLFAAAVALFASQRVIAQNSEPGIENGYYVFAYFMNNGEDGVHYAVSRDGYVWKRGTAIRSDTPKAKISSNGRTRKQSPA